MKKNTLFKFMVISISILSLFFFLSFAARTPKEISVTRSITAADLQKAFLKANADKIPLYIYIVKGSPDNGKNDLDLLFLSADANKKLISIGKPWEELRFRQECAWYVNYLKKKGLTEDSAALVYHWVINKDQFKDQQGIEVGISPFHPEKNFIRFRKIGVTGHIGGFRVLTTDSGCKYPPDCEMFFIPFSTQMKAALKKSFGK